MAALLVALNIMAVLMTVAMPLWKTATQREKEAELIWRGEQYARAIGLFQRKYANAYPPNLDILLNERFLRKKYKDPMTKDGEFQLLYAGNQAAAGGAPGQVAQQGQAGRPATATPSDAGARTPAGARGGIIGVASKSTETSLRLYNGRSKYNEWAFIWQQANQRINTPDGSGRPGMPNQPGGRRPGPGGQQPRVLPPGFPPQPGQQQPPRPFGLPQRPPG